MVQYTLRKPYYQGDMLMITFFDIEVDSQTKKVLDFGAENSKGHVFHQASFHKFQAFINETDFFCGHNIIHHDIKYINKLAHKTLIPHFKAIDTLFLSVLLYPQHPYHKLIKNDKLEPSDSNNPLDDSKRAKQLFFDEVNTFNALPLKEKDIYYHLLKDTDGFKAFFDYLSYRPTFMDVRALILERYDAMFCLHADLDHFIKHDPRELAYSLALIKTEPNSLFPEWLLNTFPKVEDVMMLLRGNPCQEKCAYCATSLDAKTGLRRFFGYEDFRTFEGENLQEMAVDAALENRSFITVLPTGGGKSLTYQLPALMRGESTRSLTVVISPLQSLMKDQVDNLDNRNITHSATINGLLDPIERAKVMENVKNGLVSILYIAPESLRSRSIERLLLGRDIARFVVDEAHCFSSWGHNFRVDYLYIGTFIKLIQEKKQNHKHIPVSCFTATAKPDVVEDIERYYQDKLNLTMDKIISTSRRKNLKFKVFRLASEDDKYRQLRLLLEQRTCPTIVYASRIRTVTDVYQRLKADGYSVAKFHGKMEKDEKISEQDRFMKEGTAHIMVATNAFGMGIDKDDIEMIIHYDISDSLENYVQESGRAARQEALNADCFILYVENDLDKHFSLLQSTKLNFKEIQQIWKAIKATTRFKKTMSQSALEIAKTAGWDENMRDLETRVKTAVAALEDSGYLSRKQNSARVFANSILTSSVIEANKQIEATHIIPEQDKETAKRIMSSFVSSKYSKRSADIESETRVDYISDNLGLKREKIIEIINYFREMNLLADFKDLAVYIKNNASTTHLKKLLNEAIQLERFIMDTLRDEPTLIHLKELNEAASEAGLPVNLKMINNLMNYFVINQIVERKKINDNLYKIIPKSPLEVLKEARQDRFDVAHLILDYILDKKETVKTANSEMVQVDFSVHELTQAVNRANRLFVKTYQTKEIEEALFYLKKLDLLTIEGGFLVLYNPMFIERIEENTARQYTKKDYEKLDNFYTVKKQHIHIVGEYANKMIEDYQAALNFVDDYFKLDYPIFLKKYFKGEKKTHLNKNITQAKFKQLFGALSSRQLSIINNQDDERIVVGAGPGSGKTRVLVHKLASIMLMEDIRYEQLLMLTFSRAAVSEFKTRLAELVGPQAYRIDIKTFHAFCFDMLGRVGTLEKTDSIIREAIEMIQDNQVDQTKMTKMMLVIDEAQDMTQAEFELVELLKEKNEQLKIIAVGDDDQNIYGFRGSSNAYFKKLQDNAAFYELIINYRSQKNLVALANQFVQTIHARMKKGVIESHTQDEGTIVLAKHQSEHLEVPLTNHVKNTSLKGKTAILTKTNQQAMTITGLLLKAGIKAKLIESTTVFKLYNMAELRFFYDSFTQGSKSSIISEVGWQEAKAKLEKIFRRSQHLDLVKTIILRYEEENKTKYLSDLKEFLLESSLDEFIDSETLIVSTLHKSKGKEFDNVYLLYEESKPLNDEEKRLLYVGITRAKQNLFIHYSSDYFDAFKPFATKFYDVDKSYEKPKRLMYELSYSDVALGYFKYTQHHLYKLKAGDELKLGEAQILTHQDNKILKFSKAYQEQFNKLIELGYAMRKIQVKYMLHWYNKEDDKEYLIAIPEIVFDLNEEIPAPGGFEEAENV
ncbi:MAG: RecQ family ATP-dependent DNA helicase [Acholeplasmatales bacterium]|nr:MAG: RecQ family ATP-dependent DNA helicase [Acholeplasmatales bacterium]